MEADKIVNHRRDERDREYGGFSQGMIKTAKIATQLCNKVITPEDTFKILMALKLSRLAHSIKFDSLVDLIGYTEGLWNFIQEKHENKLITGFDTPEEFHSYQLGREHEEKVIIDFIEKWNLGEINSHLGSILQSKLKRK